MTQTALEYTGERMTPEGADDWTFWEHIWRYRFAIPYIIGKDVLDIACGEGYGSAGLVRAGAAHLTGVDISEESCSHASRRYKIDARVGSAENIPLNSASIDTIVSFETIEHVEHPTAFIQECRRVLRRDGQLVISTPNTTIYDGKSRHNQFHCSEMTLSAFTQLLSEGFVVKELYGQSPTHTPPWRIESLYNPRSFWHRTRFLGRATRTVAYLAGHRTAADADARSRAPEIICKNSRAISRIFNPHVVRKLNSKLLASSVYVLAVATRV